MSLQKFYINGQFVSPKNPELIDVINPSTEEVIEKVALGNKNDVDKAVSAAREAFSITCNLSRSEKIDLLNAIREEYKKRFNDIADSIRLEMGAPVNLASGAQTNVGAGHLKTAIRVLENYKFEYEHQGYIIREEPIGVCGLITPWNWPINQVLSKLAPAFAAGCTVVLKPSEIAPISAMIIAEVMHEAKVPAGMFNLVNGYGPVVGEAMSSHPDIDMMSFTGSTRGGIAVATASAKSVKRVSQELGGKSPNIILDDENFEHSISRGVTGIMNNSGQSCNAPTRMLVPESRKVDAEIIAKTTAEKLIVGDPSDTNTNLGPLVNKSQFDKVQNLIESGISQGATLICGGLGKPNGISKGYFAKPTVFSDVKNDMRIAKEEIFGPVLSIISYKNMNEAINIANDTEYGLAAYVSGKNNGEMMEIAKNLRAGQVHINYGTAGPNAPFGGYKKSGNGREKCEWGLGEFLEVKAIMS